MTKKQPVKLSHITQSLREHAVPLHSVKRDERNCKRHKDKDLGAIAASLAEFGQTRPIVVCQKTKLIAAGNGTHQAAERLGWEWIAVTFVRFKSEKHRRTFSMADNRTSQLSEWDDAELALYIEDVASESEELYNALALGDLLIAEEHDSLPAAVKVPEQYSVMVTVPSEAAQKKLFQLLQSNQYTDVKLLTM